MRLSRLFLLGIGPVCLAAAGVTNIEIRNEVIQPSVKRLGINLGDQSYYDSGQLMKNLVFRNPGFEGMSYRSAIRCGSTTANSCTDENEYANWPADFWTGATFEVIHGAAQGRTGTITASSAPDPKKPGQGVTLAFSGGGKAPAAGDYVIVRKIFSGGADKGWWTSVNGGATLDTELQDLPPNTVGAQCLRINAGGSGQSAILSSYFDTLDGHTFIQLNGTYRVTFKAKTLSGNSSMSVSVARPGDHGGTYLDRKVSLTSDWQDYSLDFGAAENGNALGSVTLAFSVSGAAILMDDVSLVQLGGNRANTTAFRDPVLQTLRVLNPGLIRYMASGTGMGDTVDNAIAPPFARKRTGYSAWSNVQEEVPYGLHEFLELCETLHADPWYVVPIASTTDEMKHLIEYLAGSADTPYGAKRAARGHAEPWTKSFTTIHLELGNEAWNSVFKGAAMEYADVYGPRGAEIFRAARSTASFDASKFDLILGGQAAWSGRNQDILSNSSNYDTLAVAPYLQAEVNNDSSTEALFGPLYAEPQMTTLSANGAMRQNANVAQNAAKPARLAVYETNLHTTSGSISQANLDGFASSLGAGLAVAEHMLLMMRELGVRDQALFTLPQYFYKWEGKTVKLWGAVVDMGVTDRKRPQFLSLQLANSAIFGDMVRTVHTGTLPVWNQAKINGVELAGAQSLLSFAFVQGDVHSVVLFNLSRTEVAAVTFSGDFAPVQPVVLRQLTAVSPRSTNEDEEQVRVALQGYRNFNPEVPMTLPPNSMTVLGWSSSKTSPSAGATPRTSVHQ